MTISIIQKSKDNLVIFEDKLPVFNPQFTILNGSEPLYDVDKWNTDLKIQKTHNCYAYVLDIIKAFTSKPQPGYSSGFGYLSDKDIRSCDRMFERITSDNPSIIKIKYNQKCPKDYRKGYMAVDDGDNTDYHFYRLDKDGLWSHKPGATKVKKTNSDGKKIIFPHLSKRKSNSHDYKKSCGYFCFNPKKSNISNKPNN